MKMKTNSKRLTRAVVIGLAGVLVLSVSAFAAWGSSSGYGKYKDAVTKVFTETDNVTIDGKLSILYDGEVAHQSDLQYKIDGKDYYSMEKTTPTVNNDEYGTEYYYAAIGNTVTTFYSGEENYTQYERDVSNVDNPLSLGDYGDKVVKFGKLCADTVLGDLKNNVVLVDEKNGVRSYSLDVAAEQVPALVSSGLDLIMAANSSSGGFIAYEDSDAAFMVYYEKTKGVAPSADYFDVLKSDDATDEMWEEYNAIYGEMYDSYEEIRAKNGENAVLYVKADGSYEVYDSYTEYAFANEYGTGSLDVYLGTNPVLHRVIFDFSLDSEDRLVSNDLSVVFSSVDGANKGHTVELRFEVDFSDYGITEVQPLDVGDRTPYKD